MGSPTQHVHLISFVSEVRPYDLSSGLRERLDDLVFHGFPVLGAPSLHGNILNGLHVDLVS